MDIFKKLPLDYQEGYQDGFNACIKVLKGTLKVMGKLDVKQVQKVHQMTGGNDILPK